MPKIIMTADDSANARQMVGFTLKQERLLNVVKKVLG